MEESRNLRLHIVKRVHLDTTFVLTELCPPEDTQTEVNGCGVESINVSTKLENVGSSFLARFSNQVVCVFLKDAVVSIAIGIGQISL